MIRQGRKGLLGFAIVAVLPHVALAQPDDWSVEHFRRALDAQRKSELKTAAEEYRLVLTRNPEWAEVYLNLGITYQLQNRYGDAIQSLQKGLAIKPEMTAGRVLLGISYYMVQDFQAALKPLEEALKVNPSERQARIYLALSLLGLDRVESAVRHLRQAAQGSPDDVEILYHLGEAYNEGVRQSARLLLHSSRDSALYPWAMGLAAERKSDTNSAIEQYLKALEIDPNLAELYARLVALFERAGLAELAREASQRYALLRPRRAGKIAAGGQEMGGIPEDRYRREWQRLAAVRPQPGLPNVADVFVNKAVQQRLVADQSGAFQAAFREYERGQFAASAETFRALLQSERRDWIAGYLLARAEVAAGDFDAGEQVLEEWLAAQLEVPSVALLRIEIQSELALRCYDLVLSRQPDSIRAKMLRAKSYAAAVQTDRAISEYREVLKTHPDVPQVHLAIAQIDADELNWAAAIEELLQELELSPDNGMALALLGHAYAETENTAQAIPVLKKVLDRYPNDANALADLGKVWVRKGDPARAIEAFERALRLDDSQYKLHYRLYRLYGSMGQQELAQTHLKSFSEGEAKRRKPKMITNE